MESDYFEVRDKSTREIYFQKFISPIQIGQWLLNLKKKID